MSETSSIRYTACSSGNNPDSPGPCPGSTQNAGNGGNPPPPPGAGASGGTPNPRRLHQNIFAPGGSFSGAAGPSSQCDTPPCATKRPIRYANGAILLAQPDITVPGGGFFSQVRFYSNRAGSYSGAIGYNWWIGSAPSIVASGSSLAVVFDPNSPFWFDQSGSDYIPRNGVVGVTLVEDATDHTLTFTQTVNGLLEVTVFNDMTIWPNPGGFLSHADIRGIVTSATINSDGTTAQLERVFYSGGIAITETLLYAYVTSGTAQGQLESVTLQRQSGSGSPVPIRRALYGYCGASDPHGSVNDLQTASWQLPDGTGGWDTVAVDYYRYYLGTESTGIPHGLKYHFGPAAYRTLFNLGLLTASDSTIQQYADQYFEYDPTSAMVTKEIAAVCPSCPGGGTTTDLFGFTTHTPATAGDFNAWTMKCEQTLPDSSKVITYSNFAGGPMMQITIDPSGSKKWITAFIYTADGLLKWICQPSAVNGYDDTYDDLLNFNSGTGLYEYLNNSTGLIKVMNYYSSTGSGAVLDYLQNLNVRNGQSGSDILLRSFTYTSNIDSNGNAVYPVATDVAYPDATDPTITITTSFSYLFNTGTNVLSQQTTTLPVVGSGQNGSGATYTIVQDFDSYANLTQTTNERGIVDKYVYAAGLMGLVSQQTLNYQSGVTAPGVNIVTDFTFDSLGRQTLALGPAHNVVIGGTSTNVRSATYNVYIESIQPGSGTWGPDQALMAKGNFNTSTSAYSVVNPVTINNLDKDGRGLDTITSKRTTGSGALSPTDTFAQTDWKTWVSQQYDDQHRHIGTRTYFAIPGSGIGTVGVNYGQQTFGYDALERRNRTITAAGTITWTVWTTPQWVASVWVGTNDTGGTDADPSNGGAGGNNMVKITENQYDNGSAGGDGNLTKITRFVSGTSGDIRVMLFGYDFRNRKISTTDATGRYFLDTWDNLSRFVQSQGYSAVTGGTLFAQKQTKYDDRSRTYQTLTYAVNVSTGVVGNALVGNNWYDPSGNLLQSIGEGNGTVFTKTTFNGVNWPLSTHRGYNPSGTSYSQATTVANDIIVEQADNTFDEAGNQVSVAVSQRLNDAPTSGTGSTGALSYTTSPKARVSYMAAWFDGIDRAIANANYGAIVSFSRPTTPPASSATILVSQSVYNDAGEAYQSIDPMGNITQTTFDDAGRTTQTVEAYGTLLPRITQFLYTLDSLLAQMIAKNATTGDQVTMWDYGTTLASSGVARNDLLVSVAYPDSSGPTDVVAYAYNRLGEQRTIADQRGTIRSLYRDLLGRLTNDCVTTVGSNTDATVLQIIRAYEIRGMLSTITSTDSAAQGAGTVLNQVALGYNDFGQLIKDQQEHTGAVTSGSPSVQYGYDTGASSSNEIRLNALTYPNGRAISYNSATGMDAALNRVTSISDPSGTLASYIYLGGGTVIRITYPQPGIWLDLWGGTSGTFAGIDQFGRVIDQRWQNDITGTPVDIDRYKYGYDQNSNRLWKNNVVGTAAVPAGLDEFYAYDPLNRLTDMQRGVLNGTNTGITGTPSVEQDWTLDPTGNWQNFTTKASGSTALNQNRSANTVNEITNISATTGPTWVAPVYDGAGNTIRMPQPANPTAGFNALYDSWNRMTRLFTGGGSSSSSSGSGGGSGGGPSVPVAKYEYDGRNFRIVKETFAGGVLDEIRDIYFTAGWQDVEEQVSGTTEDQYVWGIRYIDELICRDDPTYGRLYATQDANFNLSSISDSVTGGVVERYLFDPYGGRTIMNPSWNVISYSGYEWGIGYQGLHRDNVTGLTCARLRPLNSTLGFWGGRDPVGYLGGLNVYETLNSSPIARTDPFGLFGAVTYTGTTTAQNLMISLALKDILQRLPGVIGQIQDAYKILHNATIGLDAPPCCDPNLGNLLKGLNEMANTFQAELQDFNTPGHDLDIENKNFGPTYTGTQAWTKAALHRIELNSGATASNWALATQSQLETLLFHEFTHLYSTDDGEAQDDFNDAHMLESLMNGDLNRQGFFVVPLQSVIKCLHNNGSPDVAEKLNQILPPDKRMKFF